MYLYVIVFVCEMEEGKHNMIQMEIEVRSLSRHGNFKISKALSCYK